MNVVGHQTIRENSQAGLLRVGLETVEVGMAVRVGEEDALVVHAALGDVMRYTNSYRTRKSSHLLR